MIGQSGSSGYCPTIGKVGNKRTGCDAPGRDVRYDCITI